MGYAWPSAITFGGGPKNCSDTTFQAYSSNSDESACDLPFGANAIRIFPRAQPLEAGSGGEDVTVGVTPANQLHADWQALAEAGRDRGRRSLGNPILRAETCGRIQAQSAGERL
jgi:hypothetical protein